MANLQERVQIVRDTAEEKSQLQLKCFEQINLENLKTSYDIQIRYLNLWV